MNNLFYIQLLASFLVGGIAIALLSFWAERADKKIAGIVLSLPSTVVISYIFIGWATSAASIGQIAPASLVADAAVMFFTIAYMYLSLVKVPKIYSIILSTLGGFFCWFVISLPLAIFKFDNIVLGIALFLIALMFAYYFLTYKNNRKSEIETIKYTNLQKLGRAVFAGSIITLSVFLSKTLQPFWGGIFSGFPAAFTSTFVILHWYYGSDMLFKVGKTVPKGSLVYVPYVIVAHWAFPALGILGGTVICYLISLTIFLILSKQKIRV